MSKDVYIMLSRVPSKVIFKMFLAVTQTSSSPNYRFNQTLSLNYPLKLPFYNLPLLTERTLIGSQHFDVIKLFKKGKAHYKLSPPTLTQ